MITRAVLILASILHLGFALGELLPWNPPLLMNRVLTKANELRPADHPLLASADDKEFVSTIVHNAGIYNVIMAAGFLWAAFPSLFGAVMDSQAARAIGIFFCSGAIVAGLFGLTLNPLTAIQAAVGVIGIACILRSPPND